MADLSHKQAQAWRYLEDDIHTEILYGGAAGGGKSWLGCLWLLANCLRYQGSRWLMGRSVLKTLKETTLNSFFDVCTHAGMKAGVHYVYNAQNGTISIGKSTILLKDLQLTPSDPNFDGLGSLEITGAFIDEANQVTDKAKAIVGSRIRYKLDEFSLKPKLLMTCNPAKNWVYNQFYEPFKSGEILEYRAFVPALVIDNPNISEAYIENLHKLVGPDRERLLHGNWDYDDSEWQLMTTDAVFAMWTNEGERGTAAMTWDVAGPGSDRSVVKVYDGLVVVHIEILMGDDVIEQAKRVDEIAQRFKVQRNRIVVDATGIGQGPARFLAGCHRFDAGSTKTLVNKDFKNIKTECSFALARAVNEGRFSYDITTEREDIAREFLSLRQWKGDQDGKIQVTPKKEMIKALGRSPDLLDGPVMRMALELKPGAIGHDVYRRKAEKIKTARRTEAVKRAFRT